MPISVHGPAQIAQHDASNGLLFIAQRGVEGLEGLGERLHALGALAHALGNPIETIGQGQVLSRTALLAPLLHPIPELLAGLLTRSETRPQLLLHGSPQFQLCIVELQRLFDFGDAPLEPALLQPLHGVGRQPRPFRPLALLCRLGRLRLGLLGKDYASRDHRRQYGWC
jgi:hypothetical protein